MKKILTILLLAVSLTAWGTKYYVDPNGVDDAGRNGTIGQEWATPAYACTRVSAPDTVFINAGTYNQGSTQIVKPLHIVSSYTNGSALQAAIQCASTAGTSVDDNSSISYIKLTGSSLTGTRGIHVGYRNNIQIHHVTIEDFLYTGIFVYSSITSYPTLFLTGIKIQNCTIRNCAQYGTGYNGQIRLQGTDGCDVSDCVLDARGRDAGLNAQTTLK